jgi:hypothetical protein
MQFLVRASKVRAADTTIYYAMAGTAVSGQDYFVPPGTVKIPAGLASATITVATTGTAMTTAKIATLRLQAGTGYKVSTPSRSSVTIMPSTSATPTATPPIATPTPSPSPTPTVTRSPSPTQEIWIAVRSDGLGGSGTQSDPYDGSTPEKFDTILHNYYFTPNLGVHLVGSTPFRTNVGHSWNVGPGWVISGDGMYSTTVQLVGSVAGVPGVYVVTSDPNIATDNVAIRDLTIDCNWPALASTAPTGADGEKDSGASAIMLNGSNNLLERVRCINSYGSWGNKKEQFALFLTAPRNGDGTNNIIRECRAEQPQGTYGNPFALSGWTFSTPNHLITNSKVVNCTAIGVNDGLSHGFTSGGVNLANVKECVVDSNTFIDCYGAAYIDVGSIDGLTVTNNTVVRGWMAIGLRCPGTKQNITVSGNNFQIQNRFSDVPSCGVYIDTGATQNLTVTRNLFAFETSGKGLPAFWGIAGWQLTTGAITYNTLDSLGLPVSNSVNGLGIMMSNNRTPSGSLIPGLGN